MPIALIGLCRHLGGISLALPESTTMRRQAAVVIGALVVGLLALMAAACGGHSPITASQSAPAPSAPGPAPAPEAPNLVGGWVGTYTIATVDRGTGLRSSHACSQSWIVTIQTGGQFSGTFQRMAGTTITCAQPGTFFGTISTTGELSGLIHSVTLGSLPCSRILGDGTMSGIASSTAVTAQATDRVRCANIFTYEIDRTLTLAMNKR